MEAREYSVGEEVFFRGDDIPNRKWVVTNIGDRFLKIETNTPSKNDSDMVKLVTALDIYKIDDYGSINSSMTPPPHPP